MAQNNQRVVEISDLFGETTQYQRVSARIPSFLEMYGPDKGFRIISSSQEYLKVAPGRLELLLEIIKNGGADRPEVELALSDEKRLYSCQLLDKDGNVVAEASALKRLGFNKEHESGETAAFQRLMAKLGFGGEIFNEDEDNDMNSQNLNNSDIEPVSMTSDIAPEPVQEAPQANQSVTTVTAQSNVKPAIKVVPLAPAKTRSVGKRVDPDQLQPGLLRQLASVARIKGVEVPIVETPAQLTSELKRLHELPLPK